MVNHFSSNWAWYKVNSFTNAVPLVLTSQTANKQSQLFTVQCLYARVLYWITHRISSLHGTLLVAQTAISMTRHPWSVTKSKQPTNSDIWKQAAAVVLEICSKVTKPHHFTHSCRHAVMINSYCRLINYELLRWLVETPSHDFEHYRMSGGRLTCYKYSMPDH